MLKYDKKTIDRAKRSVLEEMYKESGLDFDESLTNTQLREQLYSLEFDEDKEEKKEEKEVVEEAVEQPIEPSVESLDEDKEEIKKEKEEDKVEKEVVEKQDDPEKVEEPANEYKEIKFRNESEHIKSLLQKRRADIEGKQQNVSTKVALEIRKRRAGRTTGSSIQELIRQRRQGNYNN